MSSLRYRILPRPFFTLVLWATWLVAVGSLSLGNILLGGLLAVVVPRVLREFWPEAPALKDFGALLSYLVIVAYDIMIANINVARLILGSSAKLTPMWIEIPLDITHPYAVSILASTISLTPGTVSSNLSGDNKTLLVHCLHCADPEAQIRDIKTRYEAPLKKMFE